MIGKCSSKPNGTLYLGVTSDIVRRVAEHKQGTASRFTRRYRVHRLVYAERHDTIQTAIQRETNLKKWRRAWKINLIVAQNPEWSDLYDKIV